MNFNVWSMPINFKKILLFLDALFLILASTTVFVTSFTFNSRYITIPFMGLLLITMVYYLRDLDKLQRFFYVVVITSIIFLTFYILNSTYTNINLGEEGYKLIAKFCFVLPVFYLILSDKEDGFKLLEYFYYIMLILAFISIIFFFLVNFASIPHTGVIESNWNFEDKYYESYLGIFYTNQEYKLFHVIHIYRNQSIFTEGPTYGIMLSTALAIGLMRKKVNHLFNIILVVAALTSISYATISAMIVIYGTYIIFKIYDNKKISQLLLIILPIIVIAGGITISIMLDYKQDTASFNTRNDDYRACFATFEQYPLFGCGMMNDKVIFSNMYKYREYSLSNGFGTLLAQTGVVGVGLVSIIYGIGIVNSMNKNKYNLLLIGAMIINHVLLVGVFSYEFILVLAFMLSLSPRLLLYEGDSTMKEELLLY